jgi:hypothetical protein
MIEPGELRQLIEASGTPLRAMILLGINARWGQTDVATLPRGALDLDAGTMEFPRPKSGIDRRATLWAETVEALCNALVNRPKPRSSEDGSVDGVGGASLEAGMPLWPRFRGRLGHRASAGRAPGSLVRRTQTSSRLDIGRPRLVLGASAR